MLCFRLFIYVTCQIIVFYLTKLPCRCLLHKRFTLYTHFGPFYPLLPLVMSQVGSRFPKFTKWMSPTSLSSQNVSTLHILLFYDLVVNIWCLGPFWALFTPVMSQMGSRSPKFTKWMSPTSLSS